MREFFKIPQTLLYNGMENTKKHAIDSTSTTNVWSLFYTTSIVSNDNLYTKNKLMSMKFNKVEYLSMIRESSQQYKYVAVLNRFRNRNWLRRALTTTSAVNRMDPNTKRSILKLLSSVEAADENQYFAFPVTEEVAPGYHLLISYPMDLSTIR